MYLVPFLALFVTLPSKSATERMRLWRAVKALGCATLRDGVFLLPDEPSHAKTLVGLATEAVTAQGTGEIYRLGGLDEGQDSALQGLFDRTVEFGVLAEEIRALRGDLVSLDLATAGRRQHTLARRFDQLAATDYFPGEAHRQTRALLDELRQALERLRTPDEPSTSSGTIPRRDPADYQGRVWATRARPWVDRLASAWLIHRHIDPQARFVWLASPADCPADALGFDFDGATFTHAGARVTFETLLAAFGLEGDAALMRLGALIHCLDAGGLPVPEAAGLEAMLAGLREAEPDDDALLESACQPFDWLYRNFQNAKRWST